jgi:hypothetical protein
VAALAAAAALMLGGRSPADEPVTSSVRFTREIARILQRRCLGCHAPSGLAMPLSDYHDVRSWGRAIREEIVEQRMPPWSAAPGYGRFRNDLALTAREESTLLSWLDGGMRRGEASDLPPPADGGDRDGERPDRRLVAAPQTVPAHEELVVRGTVLDPGLERDRWVRRVVVRPGDRRVLRGALVFGGDEVRGQWLGAWLPWQEGAAPPATHAFRLRAHARLRLVLYYRGAEEPVVDRTAVELHFASAESPAPVEEVVVAAQSDPRVRRRRQGQVRLGADSTVWALQPSPQESSSLELRARRPDGSVEVLLWMPQCRREWPQALVLERPLLLPAGTTVSLITHDAKGTSAAPGARVLPRVALSLLR